MVQQITRQVIRQRKRPAATGGNDLHRTLLTPQYHKRRGAAAEEPQCDTRSAERAPRKAAHHPAQEGRQRIEAKGGVEVPEVVPGVSSQKIGESYDKHPGIDRLGIVSDLHDAKRKTEGGQHEDDAPDVAHELTRGHLSRRIEHEGAAHHQKDRHRPAR